LKRVGHLSILPIYIYIYIYIITHVNFKVLLEYFNFSTVHVIFEVYTNTHFEIMHSRQISFQVKWAIPNLSYYPIGTSYDWKLYQAHYV